MSGVVKLTGIFYLFFEIVLVACMIWKDRLDVYIYCIAIISFVIWQVNFLWKMYYDQYGHNPFD